MAPQRELAELSKAISQVPLTSRGLTTPESTLAEEINGLESDDSSLNTGPREEIAEVVCFFEEFERFFRVFFSPRCPVAQGLLNAPLPQRRAVERSATWHVVG